MSQEALENAVNEAAETVDQETKTTEDTNESTKTESTSTEDSKPDARTTQALALLDALENPKTANAVVSNLMQQLGIQMPETKKEEKAAVRDAKQIIREKLGDDFAFLSDKLGEAIEEVLATSSSKVREEVLAIEAGRQQRELVADYQSFLEKEKVSEEEAGALSKLVDEMPPSGKQILDKYLGRLLKFHRSEVAEAKLDLEKKQRQRENHSRRPENAGIEGNEERVSRGSKSISPREAVEAALRGERLD